MFEPAGYNKIQEKPHKVWTECSCGWKSRKRTPGVRMPRAVLLEPFKCPKCGKELSAHKVVR